MSRLVPVLLAIAFVLSAPALASEAEPEATTETETFETVTDSSSITINVNVPAASSSSDAVSDEPVASAEPSAETSPSYRTYSLESEPADESAGSESSKTLPVFLTELFGEYTPRTQSVTEYLSDGSSVTYDEYVPGVAGLDMEWIAAVALFALMLLCTFKIIGGLIKL